MNLIIADEEFYRGAARIHDMSDELLEIITSYEVIIDDLLKEGICDISVSNVLAEKTAILNGYAGVLASITDNIGEYTEKFITDIDDADSYLYV